MPDVKGMQEAEHKEVPASEAPSAGAPVPPALLQRKVQRRALQRRAARAQAAGGAVQRKVIGEDTPHPQAGQPATADASAILDEGEKALDAGRTETKVMPLDRAWDRSTLRFTDPAVQRLLLHLITSWLHEGDPTPLTEVILDANPPVPKVPAWVKRFRLGAMMTMKTDGADLQRLKDLATKMADVILSKTDGEKFREEFIAGIEPGQAIMSQESINAANADHKGKGKITTCIAYASDKVNRAIEAGRPGGKKFIGPNAYKEVNAAAKISAADELPPGSWKDAKTASEPPKPGDMLVITYAEKTEIGDGGKVVKKGEKWAVTTRAGSPLAEFDSQQEAEARAKAEEAKVVTSADDGSWFAHVNLLRAIRPVNPEDKEYKAAYSAGKIDSPPDQMWITIDGGGTTSKEGREFYNKSNQRLDSRFGKRFIKGWFDVAVMAGYND